MVEALPTRFAESTPEVQAFGAPVDSSTSEYSLKSSSSWLGLADKSSGDHVIAVDDIVIEGSDPYDITGHFSDLFIGMYKGDVKVAMKRLRIGKRSSHGREIDVSIHGTLALVVLVDAERFHDFMLETRT